MEGQSVEATPAVQGVQRQSVDVVVTKVIVRVFVQGIGTVGDFVFISEAVVVGVGVTGIALAVLV